MAKCRATAEETNHNIYGATIKSLRRHKSNKYYSVVIKYNVDKSTIRRIKRNTAKILEFADKRRIQKRRQRIRKPLYEELDQYLLTWFKEKKTSGDHLSDALLFKKATELRDNMGSCSSFRVSDGLRGLARFKKRHNIRLMRTNGRNVVANEEGANKFIKDFEKLMKREDITKENIYNVDNTFLLWKTLPLKILAETKIKKYP
ncbi:tigger transposable element-derived protein 2-like [Bombus vosnesenskii]|uniref:Tigger transposable element-derived protein 2-like n=1 Tax=Bombus vosnesenskii TaxID=207650 RepID=A0A6J3KND6_9HYME|nr:tigger transposable element-derived protein 2-like [Bombus vosnesenskii]